MTPDTEDLAYLRDWIGRTETMPDEVTAHPVAALSATLDRDDAEPREGDELPPLWHWLYCMTICRESEVGEDGHPKRGGFLPPVPLPQRLWAGGRAEFLHPIRIGDELRRHSAITDVQTKNGKSGPLVFVKVRHEYSVADRVAVREDHDIVYRNRHAPGEAAPAQRRATAEAQWTREFRPDHVIQFRYSALTFNGFRPHYDRPYATQVDRFPGLTVHAPLIATLLMELVRRSEVAPARSIVFRAVEPLFDIAPFTLNGRRGDDGTVELWAARQDGALAMEATLEC